MSRILSSIAAGALAFSLFSAPAEARDLTAADMTELRTLIAAFDKAIETADFDSITRMIPPKIIAAMSDDFGIEPLQILAGIEEAMETAVSQMTLESYELNIDNAAFSETSAGRPYALIPTATVMKAKGSTFHSENHTLSFADEGVWYLVRVDDANEVKFLTIAYPEFKGIDFPGGTVKVTQD